MSGHSKWHNIQGRKSAQDAKRGKIFQKKSPVSYSWLQSKVVRTLTAIPNCG